MTGLPASTHIGCVKLRVASLDKARGFYGALLGMTLLNETPGRARFGAPQGSALIELVEQRGALPQPVRAAGLYHTAFLLPRRSGLGHALRRVAEAHWPLQGASDHAVSEALYLADPDGNGVEVYADRPRESWPRANGEIAMTTLPLDLDSLIDAADAETQGGVTWHGFPEGSTVGHIHLRVPSIEEGRRLFVDVLGMDVTASRYPGALFMSAGGYHHHVAVNVWEGRNVPPLPENVAGLLDFEVIVPDATEIHAIAERARNAGVNSESLSDGVVLAHTSGIRVLVKTGSSNA